MGDTSVKEEARRLIEQLPDDASWADLAHVVAMRERLARARRDSAAGRGTSSEELLNRIERLG
ncbi:MAG: hypothetical protein IH609_18200 [Dehalococcoidia bacterium]|nr:hypothetical protein [Dehalococcoidia bacterium]